MQSIDDTTNGGHALNLPERYRVIEELGQGGMGRVYLAVDDLLQKNVAIKILHTAQTDSRKLVAFQREAKITAQLKHRNIVSILDFGLTDAGQPYLVMDYVAGESLAEVLSHSGRISVADSLPLILEILDAVKYAHSQGVLHRDLKPGNILIADNPDDGAFVKLIDFGTARFVDPDHQHDTGSGGIHGTPAYMSPEQAHGQNIDQRSEVYSLGCVLFSIWTACPPFDGDTALDVMKQHCEKNPPRLGEMKASGNSDSGNSVFPEELEQLISRCLAKDPNNRFQTADELEKELRKLDETLLSATADSGATAASEHETDFVEAPASRPSFPSFLVLTLIAFVILPAAGIIHFVGSNSKQSQLNSAVNKPSKIDLFGPDGLAPPLEAVETDTKWQSYVENGSNKKTLCCPTTHMLKDSDLKEIGNRTTYVKLKLRNHENFSGSALRFIKNPNLIDLDVAEARLNEDGWKAISEKTSLTHLDAGQSATFNGSYLKYIAKLTRLTNLSIPPKDISPKDVAIMSNTSLQAVTLCGDYSLDRNVLREFLKLKTLCVINLEKIKLKPEDLEPLRASTNLDLGIASINVTPELIQKIAELPIKGLNLSTCENLEIDMLTPLRRSKTLTAVSIVHCPKITRRDFETAQKSLAPKTLTYVSK